MSTRSTIGYETAEGDYIGVYCHFDGYPKHMIPELSRMTWEDVSVAVTAGLLGGGIRCIDDYVSESYDEASDPNKWIISQWPTNENKYNYRKRLDGTLECYANGEMIDISEYLSGAKYEEM